MNKQSIIGKIFIRIFWFIVFIAIILGIMAIIRLLIM